MNATDAFTISGAPPSLSELLARLHGVHRSGEAWMALCPAHDDHQASLKIWQEGDEPRVHCFAGCGWQRIYETLGVPLPRRAPSSDGPVDYRVKSSGEHLPIIAGYEYRDAERVLRYTIGRTPPDHDGTKHFPTWHPDLGAPGGWRWGMGTGGNRHLLYRLPEVVMAARSYARVYLAEGEKDVDNLRRGLGVTATCNPHGAGKWRDEYSSCLSGVELAVILPDNDEPGRRHADQVRRSLERAGVPNVVVTLPGLPEKGDVSDWIAAGGSRDALESLVDEALTATQERASAGASRRRRRTRPARVGAPRP